jgi:DNA (cytosine-5)-methyltransferase 1
VYRLIPNDQQLEPLLHRLDPQWDGPRALGSAIFGFGVERAGFNVAGHLELPELALGIDASRQRWPVVVAPFESADVPSWMGIAKQIRERGLVPDFLYANPPCVAYAGTGKHQGAGDERMCFTRYVSYGLAFDLQPTVWAWELVPGVFGQERGFLDAMAFRAKRHGYRCYAFLTTSAIHGGYQDRRRFHFVASRVDLDFEGVYEAEPKERKGVKTLGQALHIVEMARDYRGLGHLPNDTDLYHGAFRAILPWCPPGAHLRDVPASVMREHYRPRGVAWDGGGVPGFAHTRGRLDRPSPNVLGGHTIFHPTEDRYLTPRECATIMGFPTDYAFSEGTKAYAEIGKGLCTHNAEILARVVYDGLERDIGAEPTQGPDGSYLTVIDWRNRGKKLNLKMTSSEQRAWYESIHGSVPSDLGQARDGAEA